MSLGFGLRFVESLAKGGAVIIAGSDSDDRAPEGGKSHIARITEGLAQYHMPFEVRVCSAHKQPVRLLEIIEALDAMNSPLSVIAVAGGTDALSGTLAYNLAHPVISCPPDGFDNRGVLTNPPGSCNVVIYKPEDVGRFVAQQYAHLNPDARRELRKNRRDKVNQLELADRDISDKYLTMQRGK